MKTYARLLGLVILFGSTSCKRAAPDESGGDEGSNKGCPIDPDPQGGTLDTEACINALEAARNSCDSRASDGLCRDFPGNGLCLAGEWQMGGLCDDAQELGFCIQIGTSGDADDWWLQHFYSSGEDDCESTRSAAAKCMISPARTWCNVKYGDLPPRNNVEPGTTNDTTNEQSSSYIDAGLTEASHSTNETRDNSASTQDTVPDASLDDASADAGVSMLDASMLDAAEALGDASADAGPTSRSPLVAIDEECSLVNECTGVRATGFPAIAADGQTIVAIFHDTTEASVADAELRFYDVSSGEVVSSEILYTANEVETGQYEEYEQGSSSFPGTIADRITALQTILDDGDYRSMLTPTEANRVTIFDDEALEFLTFDCGEQPCTTDADALLDARDLALEFTIPFDYHELTQEFGAETCSPFGVFIGPTEGGFDLDRRIYAFFAPVQSEDLCAFDRPFLIWHY